LHTVQLLITESDERCD